MPPPRSKPAPFAIKYLDHAAACAWVRRHHTGYLRRVARCPHNRKHRTFADAPSFCAHLLDWAPEERRELSKKLRALVAACWSWRALLVRGPAWTFILANDDLEGGMPHTIHTAIVLPRWLVRTLLFETSDPAAKRTAYETVLHERIHVMQKADPTVFRRLYAAWGWKPVAQGGLVDRALDTLERRPDRPTRHNPDTPQRWGTVRVAADGTATTWVPYVQLGPGGMRDARYYLVTLARRQRGGGGGGDSGAGATPLEVRWHPMEGVGWYNTYFGGAAHAYHPDEAAAVLLADCMVRDAEGGALRECAAVRAVVGWSNGGDKKG